VDALSRCSNICVVDTNSFEDILIICQHRDTSLEEIKRKLDKSEDKLLQQRNGVVYRKVNDGR